MAVTILNEVDHDQVRYRFQARTRGHEGLGEFGGLPAVPTSSLLLYLHQRYRPGFADLEDVPFLLSVVLNEMFNSLSGPMDRPAHYLPADRTGVMHSHRVVVGTLIQSAVAAGLRPSEKIPLLSGVLADFLSGLIEMSGAKQSSSRNSADMLEKHVLAGARSD